MSSNLVEQIARTLAKADRIEICEGATYAASSYGIRAKAVAELVEAQLAERDARIAALTAAGDRLNGYAGHDDGCNADMYWNPDNCDCGYTEAQQGWQQAKGEGCNDIG